MWKIKNKSRRKSVVKHIFCLCFLFFKKQEIETVIKRITVSCSKKRRNRKQGTRNKKQETENRNVTKRALKDWIQVLNKRSQPLIGPRGIRFIGWTLNQLFNSISVGLKEQDVISGVKQYFDLVEITNNLWKINLLIMVI